MVLRPRAPAPPEDTERPRPRSEGPLSLDRRAHGPGGLVSRLALAALALVLLFIIVISVLLASQAARRRQPPPPNPVLGPSPAAGTRASPPAVGGP